MDDTVHIACCFDEHMELPFLVLANSIKRHLKEDRKVVLHAFHSDPLVHDRAFSRSLHSGTFSVRFFPTPNRYGSFPMKNSNKASSLMRFMLPTLLENVDRILYLDTDLIVLTDITPLFDADLNGCALAAVLGYSLIDVFPKNGWLVGVEPDAWPVEKYMTEVIQLTNWKTYFNAGVLVMDLNRFRKDGLIAKAESFLERTKGTRVFNDQDALNHIVDGAFVALDPRWNVNAGRIEKDFDGADAGLAAVAALWKSDPWIVHYCFPGKPWSLDSPRTVWDQHFWSEAGECEVFPLLLNFFLKQCDQRGLLELGSPKVLLASGKPAFDKCQLEAHARKFGSMPEVSSADMQIAARLDEACETGVSRPVLVPVSAFKNNGGASDGQTLAFNLADATGHIVYGPYLWYPPGNFEAVFEIQLSPGAGNGQSRLVMEVTDDSDHFLAQRFLSVTNDLSESCCALNFTATGRELFLEFRIFADGFDNGILRFSGVRLNRVGKNLRRADSGQPSDVPVASNDSRCRILKA